jgi:dolichyl-diphosphooligosaccharide--protein glycosyltransferase
MSDIRNVTDELLTDRPSIEDDLEAVLAADDRVESWAFEDIPVESGTFGELVSRGIVESVNDGYQVADPAAVRAALENEPQPPTNEPGTDGVDLSVQLPRVDPVLAGALVGLLALILLLRTVAFWPSVFRGSDIVLLGNDPYFYRYWLEELFRTSGSVTSPPPALQDHDIAMIAVMHGLATLLGGGREAVSLVLTWYPVVASVGVGLLVYVIAIVSFADYRVALASVAMYAVTPIVAYRSALGFGDHHAFDYLLVALAVAGLLLLVDERADWRTVTWTRPVGFSIFALAVAMQVHAWRGGPLLLLPVAAYVVFRVASDARAGDSPLQANAWTLGALAAAAGLAIVPHVVFGWSGVYRAVAPALLLVGSLVVVGIGELAARREIAASTVLGLEAVGGLVAGGIAWVVIPDVQSAIQQGVTYFVQYGQTNITETRSLLSPEYGVVGTPIFYLGLSFFLATATISWAVWRVSREHRPTWLALTTYTGILCLMALVQLRFAGQFGILASVFAGLGFVYLVAAVDVTERPRPFLDSESDTGLSVRENSAQSAGLSLPDQQLVSAVVVLFLLIGSLGAVQTANGSGLVVEEATYDAATAIDAHATTTDQTWPDNYIFSDWGRNRVYNYYVNNQSESYGYALNNYNAFLASENPSTWYDQLSEKPTGYVVVTDVESDLPPTSMQSRLWDHWGSRSDGVEAVGHYRAVYANDERKVYELVPGAMLVGRSELGESQTVRTEFDVGRETHMYEREVTATANGWYAVRVPYTGTYNGTSDVSVSDTAVRTGAFVGPNSKQSGTAHWPLNASSGVVAFDVHGGHHGRIQGATWTDSGLLFNGDSSVRVPTGETLSPKADFTLSVTFRTTNTTDYREEIPFPRLAGTSPGGAFRNSTGYQLALSRGDIVATVGNERSTTVLDGPRVDDGEWHTAMLIRDGDVLRLRLDGTVVAEKQYTGTLPSHEVFEIGSTPDGYNGFVGEIQTVTYENTTVFS